MKKMIIFIGVFILFVIFSIQYSNLIRNTVDLQQKMRNQEIEIKPKYDECGIFQGKSDAKKKDIEIEPHKR